MHRVDPGWAATTRGLPPGSLASSGRINCKNVIFNDVDRAAAVSGRNRGRFLTIIYPDELRDGLFGTEAVTAFPAGQDLIRELGFAISRASSVVLPHSGHRSSTKTGASRGAWFLAKEFIDSVWYGSGVKTALR